MCLWKSPGRLLPCTSQTPWPLADIQCLQDQPANAMVQSGIDTNAREQSGVVSAGLAIAICRKRDSD